MLLQVEKEDSWTHRGAIQAAEIIHRAKNQENFKISRQNSADRKNDLVILESENYGPQFSIEKVQKTSLKPSSLISDVSLVNSNGEKEADEDTLTEEDFPQEEVFGVETLPTVNKEQIIAVDLDFCKANFDQSSSSISIPLIKNRRANMQIQILKMVKKSPPRKSQPIAKPRKSLLTQQQKSLKIENGEENLTPTTPITPKISVLHFERKNVVEEKPGRKAKNVEPAGIKTCKNCHKQMANQKNMSTSSVLQQKADKQQQTTVNNINPSVMVTQTDNPYHVSTVSNGKINLHMGMIDNQRQKSSGQDCDSADPSAINGFEVKSTVDLAEASKVKNQSMQQSISVEQIIDLCIKPPKFEISIEPVATSKFIENTNGDDRTSRLPLTNFNSKNRSSFSPPSSAKNLKAKLKITTENNRQSKKLSRSASLDQKISSYKKNTALSISHLSVIDKLKSVDQEMLKLLTLGEELGASVPKTLDASVESRAPVVDARKISSVTVESRSLPYPDVENAVSITKKSDSSVENQDSSSPSSFATASSQLFEFSSKNASEKPVESSYKRALRLLDEQQETQSALSKNSCIISNQSLRIRSALDQASTMIDEMLRLARVKHKEEKIQFKKAADELDKVYEQMKFEINSHKMKIVNNGNNNKKERKENLKFENPSLELKFEKIVDKENDQKMDYTKKWLDDDLKSFVNDKPDLLQFCSKKLDHDQKSVGSASAEVAAITNKERLHALRVPDLVPEEPSSSLAPILRPAPIHPLKRRQIPLARPRDIYTCSPTAHSMDRHSIQTHLHKNYRKSSTSDYQSSTSVILSLAQKDLAGGMVKKQVDVFDKMSDQDYESDRSYWSDNMAAVYSSSNAFSNNVGGKILSSNVAGFVKKFESDEKMSTSAKNGLSKHVTAEQARLETCIRGVKSACKMQARTVSLSRNGSTHSLPVFCINAAGVNNRESSTISVGDSALVNKIDEYSSTVTPSSYCSLQRSGYGSVRYDFQNDHEQRLQKMNDILNELSSVNCSNSCSSLNNDRRKVSPARQSLKAIPEYNEHYENINYSREPPIRRDYKEEKRNDQLTSKSCSISTNENAPALPPRNFSKRTSWHEPSCLRQQENITVQPEHHHHQKQDDIYEIIPILCEQEPKISDSVGKIAGASSLDRHLNFGEISKEEYPWSNNNVKKQPLFKNLLQFFNRNSTTAPASAKIGETFATTSIDKTIPATKNLRILRKSHSDSQNRIGDFSPEKNTAAEYNDKQKKFRLTNWGFRGKNIMHYAAILHTKTPPSKAQYLGQIPFSPALPGSPGLPGGPAGPSAPGLPGGPLGPLLPGAPGLTFPASPGGPEKCDLCRFVINFSETIISFTRWSSWTRISSITGIAGSRNCRSWWALIARRSIGTGWAGRSWKVSTVFNYALNFRSHFLPGGPAGPAGPAPPSVPGFPAGPASPGSPGGPAGPAVPGGPGGQGGQG
uniref:Uncharacterized protein n=1 Tax=Romanomermis culicivorax TaxID=13658 RepID=A0A915I9W1_ROMCU